MDGQQSARASFNQSFNYTPLRKPHQNRDDTSTSSTHQQQQQQRTSILSPDAPVFIPKRTSPGNHGPTVNYPNHAGGGGGGGGTAEGLTKNFSNMNVAPKNVQNWCTSQGQQQQRQQNHSINAQDRLHVSSSGVHQNHHQQQHHQHQHHQQQQHQHHHHASMNVVHHHHSPHPLLHHHQHHQQQQQHHHHPTNSSLQNRLNYSSPIQERLQVGSAVQGRLNVAGGRRDLVHSNYSQPENDDQESGELPEDEKFALDYISHIVSYLNENPGSFDSIATRALSVFEGFGDNQFVLSNSMEIIFNKSIEEQNFRYMGARLYALLDSINAADDSTFRNLLSCKLTYHQTEIMKYMQNDNNKVRGTTLFLAELYMQLRNDGIRIPQIAQNIVFCMNQLLMKTTPENIKCICLTLKLAGYDLEIDYPIEISKIIEKLRSLKHIDNATSRVLENVLELQKNNWGRSEIQASPPTFSNETYDRLGDVPVFYGPDGQVLTEEENNFLESNLPHENNLEEDIDSDDEYELDPEMDAEMEKAYRDFLKTNPNNAC